MCGIFGVLTADERLLPDDGALAAAARDLRHRGPDAAAHTRTGKAAFAHTRLALLDLHERANQPMWDETRRHCLLFNGEIYNFRSLRSELERAGRSFRTESDTEVLLQGLLHEGTRFLPRLEGMFAFALYDTVEDRLLLARDRFGIKPLVYATAEGSFCFASEVRPLRHCLELAADPYAVAAYLAGADPATQGETLFAGVRSLESGHWLEVDGNRRITREPFFSIPDFHDPELAAELEAAGPRAMVRRLDATLHQSIEKHLIADVEVGCLASGGLDSSLITAMAVRHKPDLVLFHADVVGRKSERDAAERLARYFKLDLHTVPVDDEAFLSLIPETVLHYEAPISYHPNSVPFLAVAKLVERHGVKAILSGEGSDEAFLGYASARRSVLAQRFGWFPGVRHTPAESNPGREMLSRLERWSDRQSIETICGGAAVDPMCLELLSYHLRTLMHRNDRLGMAASIEARFPFLDHDLVAFAANVGPQHKVKASPRRMLRNRHPIVVKWLVRRVAEAYLPPDLAYRRKRGFPTTGMRRLEIEPSYFDSGWVRDELQLSANQMKGMLRQAPRPFLSRLLLLELWGSLLVRHQSLETVRDGLEAHARICPE
ncbi:MAG: asparagine synthase (glutamine-hydrolyzing) [Thermoanaerobaculia bacterium]